MEKKWFVVYTRPQQELKVTKQLSAMGIKNYCPTVTLVKQYSDRKKKVIKPLIYSYVMVHLEEKERKANEVAYSEAKPHGEGFGRSGRG